MDTACNLSDGALAKIIKNRVRECEAIYSEKFDVQIHSSMSFQIRGRSCGGSANPNTLHINFNLDWARANLPEYLSDVVPHEVGHLVAHVKYPYQDRGHGRHWKHVVSTFGIRADRTTRAFKNAKPARHVKKFRYELSCGCTPEVSIVRHNRINDGTKYSCKHHTTLLPEHFVGRVQ